jgi:hypothetical protein
MKSEDEKTIQRSAPEEIFYLSFHLFHLFSPSSHLQPPAAQPLSSLDEKAGPFFIFFPKGGLPYA